MLTIVKYILIQSMPIIQETFCGKSKTESEITDQCLKHLNISKTWNSYSVKNEDYYLYNTNKMVLASVSLLFGITGYILGVRRRRERTLISSETETDSLYDTSTPTFKDQMTSTSCTRPTIVSMVTPSFYPPNDHQQHFYDNKGILLPEDIPLPPDSFKKTTIYPISKQKSSLNLDEVSGVSEVSNESLGSLETINTTVGSIPIPLNLPRRKKGRKGSYMSRDSNGTNSSFGSDPNVILF